MSRAKRLSSFLEVIRVASRHSNRGCAGSGFRIRDAVCATVANAIDGLPEDYEGKTYSSWVCVCEAKTRRWGVTKCLFAGVLELLARVSACSSQTVRHTTHVRGLSGG
jgi:hypothetical protein